VDRCAAELLVVERLARDEEAFFVAILSLLKVSYEAILAHFREMQQSCAKRLFLLQ